MSTIISEPYLHLIEYCETDAMRIVHHAEYIKWMEYARHRFLLSNGVDWAEIEREQGLMMPMLSVSTEYRRLLRFGDTVAVRAQLEAFDGVYLRLSYRMENWKTGELCAIGRTKSGFVDRAYRPVLLQDAYEEAYKKLIAAKTGAAAEAV